jgi:integrase
VANWPRFRGQVAGGTYVQPVQSELGALAIQDLTRRHIDDLIVKVRSDQLVRPGGKARKARSARSCNYSSAPYRRCLASLLPRAG